MKPHVSVLIAIFLINNLANCEVITKLGRISGTLETFENVQVERFLGIRFAQPPIGAMRFRKPFPVTEPWSNIFNATQWPPSCPQKSPLIFINNYQNNVQSEDCLFLNIWKPITENNNTVVSQSGLKPVLLYIYGGAYLMGSTSSENLNGLPLAALGDVIVVTVNYRLGALGFLFGNTKDMPGNLALWDNLAALNWIKDNVASFGGDPNQITIFGESAGAISVGALVMSPPARELFKNAIMMSGSPLNPLIVESKQTAIKKTIKFAAEVGCLNGTTEFERLRMSKLDRSAIRCLRELSPDDLLNATDKTSTAGMPFVPYHGDNLLPTSPDVLISSKTDSIKLEGSLMVGVVTYEGAVVEMGLSNDPQLRPLLKGGNQTQWRSQLIKKINELPIKENLIVRGVNNSIGLTNYYFDGQVDDPRTNRKTFSKACGDYYLGCPTLAMGEQLSKVIKKDVYGYVISYKSKSRGAQTGYNQLCGVNDGVCHATELQFLFGRPLLIADYDDHDRQQSRDLIKIWTDFAKFGNTSWGKYYRVGQTTVPVLCEINPTVTNRIRNDYDYLKCKLWEPYLL